MAKHQRSNSPGSQTERPRDEPRTEAEATAASHEETHDIGAKIATVAVVGVAAALIEAELVPGILLGAAAVFAPSIFPRLGNGLRPLVKGAVRAGYSLAGKARETFAEASENLQDIVAEVKAEAPMASGMAKAATEAAASGEIV